MCSSIPRNVRPFHTFPLVIASVPSLGTQFHRTSGASFLEPARCEDLRSYEHRPDTHSPRTCSIPPAENLVASPVWYGVGAVAFIVRRSYLWELTWHHIEATVEVSSLIS